MPISVIATAGASLVRDSVDKRLIGNVVKQAGSLISDPAAVGGFGTLKAEPRPRTPTATACRTPGRSGTG